MMRKHPQTAIPCYASGRNEELEFKLPRHGRWKMENERCWVQLGADRGLFEAIAQAQYSARAQSDPKVDMRSSSTRAKSACDPGLRPAPPPV